MAWTFSPPPLCCDPHINNFSDCSQSEALEIEIESLCIARKYCIHTLVNG